MIAYRVHVYTRASLIHSPNRNPDSSNRISPKTAVRYPVHDEITERLVGAEDLDDVFGGGDVAPPTDQRAGSDVTSGDE